MFKHRRHILRHGVTAIAVGLLWLAGSPAVFAQASYIGSDACAACHLGPTQDGSPGPYEDWSGSGHPFILMSAEDARNRSIPLPRGFTWEDIEYVVGGHANKVLFVDENGYFITSTGGSPGYNQFNFKTGEWSDYRAGEAMVPYDCGSCHTTGFSPEGNQGGLPGMLGTFEYSGVQCEACHGPNARGPDGEQGSHPAGPGYIDGSADACGRCHKKNESGSIPVSGGFIEHENQYNEFKASPHRNMDCVSCHNPHKRSEWSIKPDRECEDCHGAQATAYESTSMFAAGVECKDCHMSRATLSGQPLGPYEGDMWTHLFRIEPDASYEMFNGNTVALDGEGQGKVSVEFACLRCHGSKTAQWAEDYAENFHSAEFGITSCISGTWWNPARNGEGWLVDAGGVFVAAFYTYDNAGNQTWLLGTGVADGNSVTLNVIITNGPQWGTAYDPNDYNSTEFGSATFTFTDPNTGSVAIMPNQAMVNMGFEAVTVDITRIQPAAISCPVS